MKQITNSKDKEMNNKHNQPYYQHTINKNNQTKLITHFNLLVERYSKLLPLRLDLHYKLDPDGLNGTVAGAYSDMFLLYAAIQSNLTDVVGFAFCLEYSTTERLHIHSVFYIDGQKHRGYYGIQKMINELWHERISKAGNIHSCNQAQNYTYDGLKNFNHLDIGIQNNFKKTLDYMSKNEQKEKIPEMYQVGVSIIPPKSKAGRPRKYAMAIDDGLGLF